MSRVADAIGRDAKGALFMRLNTTAVLIACKNGEATIGQAVASAVAQADVYVVSDGSTDSTAETARRAGARVLVQQTSQGKPAALRSGVRHFGLAQSYAYIAVLDDDTTLADDYVRLATRRMDGDATIAATSGRIDALWDHARRWNALVAMRAFTYWSYQMTIKRAQGALRVVNVICGANTVFRADVFTQLIADDVPYAIDDMYWVAELAKRRLGRVAYAHDARSWTIDPHRFPDWYRQTVRWSWGQFQSVRGHRLGLPLRRDRGRRLGIRFSWFDFAYLALLVDWLPYMAEPLLLPPAAYLLRGWIDPLWFLAYYLGSSVVWIGVAAAALRKPRLLLLAPALIALDLVYRVTMVHALVKAIRVPTVASCTWDSPARFELDQSLATQTRGN
jgi:poly-beta-1,6-N-acetyl-D-glucosamine synthase